MEGSHKEEMKTPGTEITGVHESVQKGEVATGH